MSDEASSSAAAHDANDELTQDQVPAPTPAQLRERRKKNRQTFNKKRCALLEELLRNIDILVYAELSAIYYLDCSFLRFLLRALPHFLFLTPKPPFFPEHRADRPYIGIILGTNIFCVLVHIIWAAPVAGEATRGFLHGGLVMDFIGQRGGASRVHLLLLDLLLLGLQLVQVCAKTTKTKLGQAPVQVTTSSGREYSAAPAASQDLDSEERGVRRSEERDGIEMQNLTSSGTAENPAPVDNETETESSERDRLLATTAPAPQTADYQISDAFNSGQIVLGDFKIFRTVKEQIILSRTAAREPPSLNREVRANITGQLLRWRFGGNMTGR